MEVPDFLLHRASCGSSFAAAGPVPPSREPRPWRETQDPNRGLMAGGGGEKTQDASRPAQAPENFRNCKRDHELDCLRTSQEEEGVKRKRVLLRAPTFSEQSLREF